MPKSSREGKDIIIEWAKLCPANTILDIGAGSGTYRKLFLKNNLFVNTQWIAVEAWSPYIDEFNLNALYNKVINDDVRNVNIDNLGPIDITFMGDVLEHITKEESIKLVDSVMKISKHAVISIPIIDWPQNERHGNPFEKHVKDDWSDEEVMATFSKYIKKSVAGNRIGVYWLEQ